jgi:hypothetical protein
VSDKICNGCKEKESSIYDVALAFAERTIVRLWVVIIILIAFLVGTNIGWLVYESQFETVETTEEITVESGDDGIANYIGQDGDIYNGEGFGQENN